MWYISIFPNHKPLIATSVACLYNYAAVEVDLSIDVSMQQIKPIDN